MIQQKTNLGLAALVSAEWIKHKRGFLFWFSILAPATIGLFMMLGVLASRNHNWQEYFMVTLEFWGISIPMGCAILAAFSVAMDNNAQRFLMALPIFQHKLFLSKFVTLAILTAISATSLAVVLLIGRFVFHDGSFFNIFWSAIVSLLTGLGWLAVCLLASELWGMGASIALGFAGLLTGALLADKTIWPFVPSAWPARSLLPIAGMYANGIPIENQNDPLLNQNIIPIIILMSLALMVVALFIGARMVDAKENKRLSLTKQQRFLKQLDNKKYWQT